MLLLILAALFLILLTIAIFFLVHFDYGSKKDKQVLVMDKSKNQIYGIESGFEYNFIDKNRVQKVSLELLDTAPSIGTQKGFIRKPYRHHKSICAFKAFVILFVPFVTWGIYSLTGSPGVKSYFFSELMDKDPKTLNRHERLVRLQTLFFRMPNDGKIADALAISYFEEGLFQDSVNIYLDALRLNGETAPRLVGYGLALVGYEGGIITQEAQNAFQKAADLAPDDFYPRLFLANGLCQIGKPEHAVQLLQNFLDTMSKNAPGRSHVEAMITQLRGACD
ncbi:tetratricopeptide repeat protein [Bartonella bovis]|uniref:Cytochrome c-type biogenesis protein CycH n=1 Tax=Bartonella bovis m02 TaxID=1094492 RepID=N6UTA3_9HYPH|nr:cytochrome c-type biogenesis protein CycH [Bartonella bovis]ENN93378.1 cytochrome c-type biogenesis protein CycH [Bartonella bovis m02]